MKKLNLKPAPAKLIKTPTTKKFVESLNWINWGSFVHLNIKLKYFYHYRKGNYLYCAIVCRSNKKYYKLPWHNSAGKDMRSKLKERKIYDT